MGDKDATARRATVANRLSGTPKGIIPERGQLSQSDRVKLFCDQAESVQASVSRVKSYEDIPKEVAAYLRLRNLESSVRMGEDERLAAAPWDSVPNLERSFGPADWRGLNRPFPRSDWCRGNRYAGHDIRW